MPPQKHVFAKPKKDKASKDQVIWCDLCGKVVKSGKFVKCEVSNCGIVVHKKCHSSAMTSPCPHPSVAQSSAAIFKRPVDDCYIGCKTFVTLCIKEIEKDIRMQGIYRVCGLQRDILAIKSTANKDPIACLKEPHDVHAVTGALKLWIRELPEPLVPFSLYDMCIATAVGNVGVERRALMKVVKLLPDANRDILLQISLHLKNVSLHADENMMTTKNLAIVFAPNVLRPEIETPEIILGDAKYSVDIMTALISDPVFFFDIGPPPVPPGGPPIDLSTPERGLPPIVEDITAHKNARSEKAPSVSSSPSVAPRQLQWPPLAPEFSRFRVIFPEVYKNGAPESAAPRPAPRARLQRRQPSHGRQDSLDVSTLRQKYATHRDRSTRAFATLRHKLEQREQATQKSNTLEAFVATIKEGTADEKEFPELTAWVEAYSQ